MAYYRSFVMWNGRVREQTPKSDFILDFSAIMEVLNCDAQRSIMLLLEDIDSLSSHGTPEERTCFMHLLRGKIYEAMGDVEKARADYITCGLQVPRD